jgi:alkanesulfonate monooxygenase SsuD/methylene tetrahydromethanopterin reductase-like flavin-dependent oxidoreductase (luciferase family)
MKCSIWVPGQYADEGLPEGWPAPGKYWEPERGVESVARAFELYDIAVAGGFDMVSVAEHHYGHSSFVPSPTVMAAALAQRYPDVRIGILGPVLPLSNPVRVAEEIAMVDVLSGGRTVVGFFRGVASEQLVFGANPELTADMFREALALVLHAWTEPETFGWEGRHYRFRTVSAFPRPLQQPHPPIVSSATTVEAARWIGASGHLLGIFAPTVSTERAAEVGEAYRAARTVAGSPAAAEDIVYRARIYVAASDEEAEADAAEYRIGDMRRTLAPAEHRAKAAAKVNALLYAGKPNHGGGPPALPRPDFYGSPATVLDQLRESAASIGWGFLDGLFTSPGLPHEKARRSLALFAAEVLPQLAQ